MKSKILAGCLLALAALLSGCNETVQKEVVRKGGMRANARVEVKFPLGHEECEKSIVNRCYESKHDCRQVCVEGKCERQCEWIPGYCQDEVVESCRFVKESDFIAYADLRFDPRAKLANGQEEKYSFRGNYDSTNKQVEVQVGVSSRYYDYQYPKKVVLKHGKTTALKFTATRVK